MSDARLDAARIGPTIDLADVALPEAVGRRLGTLYGTDEPIRDAEAWVVANRDLAREHQGRPTAVEDLCTTTDGAHVFEARDDEFRQAYVCVLDPLIYPVVTDTPGTVRSVTPVREETITMEVDADGVTVSQSDAVVSLGVSESVAEGESASLEVLYREVCAYVHVFDDADEYDAWAADVDAATTSLPVDRGVGLATALAAALFE